VGQIDIQTKVDEVLASGLNKPIAVRHDALTGNLFFLEAGMDAWKHEDDALKAISARPSLEKTGLTINLNHTEILEKESATVKITGRLTDESGLGVGGRPLIILGMAMLSVGLRLMGTGSTATNGRMFTWRMGITRLL